mmetsp:Transcript_30106/g.59072  ORF Transcript_30106/g.59072 Transcript_30106/m.59072 type:complete len:108 (+) Transcript_30106:535-858(+)
MSGGAPSQLASAKGDFASLSWPPLQTGSATNSRLRLPAQMQRLCSARVQLGTPSRVPKLANMPRRKKAARMGPSATTATSATGNAVRVDGRHAELQRGQGEPVLAAD